MRRVTFKRSSLCAFALVLVAASSVEIATAQASSPRTSTASEFDAPSGLAFGGGHLWVTNEAGNSVTEIDPSSGDWLGTMSRSTSYRFNRPTAITGSGANLFIANAGNSVSEIRASNGAAVRTVSGATFHFADPVAIGAAGNTILVLNAGQANGPGSITEINAATGKLRRVVAGASFAFRKPAALAVAGADVFVADEGNNSVTEVDIATGRLVRVVALQGLDAPDGIAVEDGQVWVADSASNAATDISEASGVVITTVGDSDGQYGFGDPATVIGAGGSVYIATPYGASPMVTNVTATTGAANWYMCNTNGPYYFSLLSAFAVSGDDLWVASRSGANSQTPGAATGSLTEMNTVSGALIATFPAPPASSTTTTTS
jgi:hypothetical protein